MSDGQVVDVRRRWQDYTDVEFAANLAADSHAKCTQCEHTKVQHYAAGPQCIFCDCPGLLVNVEEALGGVIWRASHADEGTISAAGANVVARAVLAFLNGGS